MATCENCVHYEFIKTESSSYCLCSNAFNVIEMQRHNHKFKCDYFKDKSRYIELPCMIGDTVYYITGIGHNLIKPAKVLEIILDENGIKDLYVQYNEHNFFENSFDIFFITREEAEKALKEREQE